MKLLKCLYTMGTRRRGSGYSRIFMAVEIWCICKANAFQPVFRFDIGASLHRRRNVVIGMALTPPSDVPHGEGDTCLAVQINGSKRTNSSASANPLESLQDSPILVPSIRDLLAFAIPAIGVWLCSPLLSLIDTSTVGLMAGTLQQAALNPAVAVTDYSARALSFLYTGTTNMVAIATEEDRNIEYKPRMRSTFVGALQLALLVGTGLGTVLFLTGGQLLRALIGNQELNPEIFAAAIKYVRIRALGMPAAAIIGTAQAASLGMKDIRSPLQVIVTAAVVNLVLDLLLVGQPYAWLGGTAGAAWATIISQYVSMSLFLRKLGSTSKAASNRVAPDVNVSMNKNVLVRPRNVSSRGILANLISWRNLVRIPELKIRRAFAPYVVPVTTTQVGRCSTYIAMGHVVSSSFGTVSMAAHQIITSIFYSLIPIADSLGLTAQSFLPGMLTRQSSREKALALKAATLNLFKVALLSGVLLAGFVGCIPLASQLFTADVGVRALVQRIVPILLTIFSLHGIFCGSEGILLARRDLKFLGRMYAVYFAVVPYLMLQIKRSAKRGASVDLTSVWKLFLWYQLVRISIWVGRVVWLQRQTDRDAVNYR